MVTFADLGLSPEVLRAIADSGYTIPTPIQEKAIPKVLEGRDVLGIAQTGTGKTASFTVPMIEILSRGRAKARMPRTLILEPTRELAAQVAESFDKYGKYHKLTKALLIGGVSFGDQDTLLSQGVDVLIATPGRLLDHFERGKLLLSGVQVMVVDEADRMLDMGFIPDIERIFKMTPFTRQTLFFSATMPPEITRITEQFLQNPIRIEVSKAASTAITIALKLVALPGGDPRTRRAALRAVLQHSNYKNGIIFCNRKTEVDIVAKSLQRHGYNAAPLHGDLDQRSRTQTLDRFKTGDVRLLVASDVAARGLDIPDVSHIFNYEPSRHAEDFVHRVGRTGRAGKSGEAYTLAAPADSKSIAAIEKLIGKTLERVSVEGIPETALGDTSDRGGWGREREERRTRRRGPRSEASRSDETQAPREEPPAPLEVRSEPAPSPERVRQDRPRQDRSAQDRQRRHEPREDTNADGVAGFGGEAPAFLTRAAKT
ncbi:MAG TPA: DEAD/DEAH box helicase [Caulobacterales bacterium]|nr:DEAD/DEAH box helicase [Caulobacterales bacterium]